MLTGNKVKSCYNFVHRVNYCEEVARSPKQVLSKIMDEYPAKPEDPE